MSGILNTTGAVSGILGTTAAPVDLLFSGTRTTATVDGTASIVYTFLRSGAFIVPAGGLTIDLLICGGGGAGHGSYSGGG